MENKEVSGNQAIAYRNYRRARDRALVRLSHDYPNLYRQYLEEEKAYDENEGAKWVKSNSRNTIVVGVRSRKSKSRNQPPQKSNRKRNKGKRR